MLVRPRRMTLGSSVTSGAMLDRPVEIHGRWVAHRHARLHVGLVEPHAQAPLGGGQLVAVVDAVKATVVLEADRGHDPAVLASELDQVGQVQLAGRRGRCEAGDPTAQPGRVEGVQARVGLVRVELLGRRVLRLHDPLDGPELAAHDATERGRIGGEDRGKRDRRVIGPTSLEHRIEVGAGHERHVAVHDHDLARRCGHRVDGGTDRVPGAAWLVLEGEDGPIGEGRRDVRHRRRVDHDRRRTGLTCFGARPGVEDIRQHRSPAERMEDLGQRRAHAGPEPSREHDGDGLRRVGIWGVHEGQRIGAGVGRRRSLSTRYGPGACGSDVIGWVAAWYGRLVRSVNRGAAQRGSRAMASISTRAPFGRAATPTVDRAGGGSARNRA